MRRADRVSHGRIRGGPGASVCPLSTVLRHWLLLKPTGTGHRRRLEQGFADLRPETTQLGLVKDASCSESYHGPRRAALRRRWPCWQRYHPTGHRAQEVAPDGSTSRSDDEYTATRISLRDLPGSTKSPAAGDFLWCDSTSTTWCCASVCGCCGTTNGYRRNVPALPASVPARAGRRVPGHQRRSSTGVG